MLLSPVSRNTLIWCAIAALVAAMLWSLGPVLMPFAVAAVLAYVLEPLVRRLSERARLPRWAAALLVELLALLLLLGLLLLLVPVLAREWPALRQQLPQLLDRLNAVLAPLLASLGMEFSLDLASVKAALMTYLSANLEDGFASLLSSLQIGGSVALTLLGNLVLIPVALFYLLLDWPSLARRVLDLVPLRLRTSFEDFMRESDAVLGQYLRGQMIVMFILAIWYSVGLSLFGLALALPIGIFTGLAIFVPYVGFGFGLLLAVLAGLLEFSAAGAIDAVGGEGGALARTAIMVGTVYGLGQLIESFWLTPRLVGERIGLHPLAVIFALLAFGQLFGFVGVLLALPASAVLLVAARRLRRSYQDSSLYRE